jgi:catechol 2,3-dioxygenase-like lactoylglutathione lyase family enzyme
VAILATRIVPPRIQPLLMAAACACCGEEREVVALRSRDDVQLCRDCVGWLAGRLGVTSTPTLPVTSLPEAIAFYERAGFGVRVYEDPDGQPGGFAFVDFNGQSVFDLDVVDIDPARNGAGCYLVVQDIDDWHARLTAAALPVTALADQPWGMREFTLTDPSGNNIRIGRGSG